MCVCVCVCVCVCGGVEVSRSSVLEETSVSCQADVSNRGFRGDITLGVGIKRYIYSHELAE